MRGKRYQVKEQLQEYWFEPKKWMVVDTHSCFDEIAHDIPSRRLARVMCKALNEGAKG